MLGRTSTGEGGGSGGSCEASAEVFAVHAVDKDGEVTTVDEFGGYGRVDIEVEVLL